MAVEIDTRSLAGLRAKARAPRIAVTICAVVLSGVGLTSLLRAPEQAPVRPAAAVPEVDLAAQVAAEFAARKLVAGTDSRVIGDEPRGLRDRLVTVTVTNPDPVDVAVLVSRDARGRIVVREPLAIVGSAPTRRAPVLEGAREVTDAAPLARRRRRPRRRPRHRRDPARAQPA